MHTSDEDYTKLNLHVKGNSHYNAGRYKEALTCYSAALKKICKKTTASDEGNDSDGKLSFKYIPGDGNVGSTLHVYKPQCNSEEGEDYNLCNPITSTSTQIQDDDESAGTDKA